MLEVAQRYVGDKQLFGQPLKFVRNLIESVMSTTIFSKRDICDIFNLVINTQNCAVALYHLGCRCDVDKINMLCRSLFVTADTDRRSRGKQKPRVGVPARPI